MNCRFSLLVIILVSLLISCACSSINKDKSANAEEVIFDDGYNTSAKNEIIFDDIDFEGQERTVSASGGNSKEIIKIASDSSKISTTFDVYGNKTEIRTFNYNPRLSFILLRTSTEEKKQVFVYGQNGDVKSLPENMLDKVLTASADEIANSAGIPQQQRQISIGIQNNPLPDSTPLRPMPSYNFPIQNRPVEPIEKEEKSPDAQQPSSQNKETTPVEKNNPLP